MIFSLLACVGSPSNESNAVPSVSDPRAYVVDAVLANDENFLKAAWINPSKPDILDPWLDKKIANDIKLRGSLPNNSAKLDRFIYRISGGYLGHVLDSEAGRAEVERLIRERYDNPVITFEDGVATADHGWAPGPIVSALRQGWQLGSSPELVESEPAPAKVVEGFRKAHAAHDSAKTYRVVFNTWEGASLKHRFTYHFDVGKDLLFLKYDTTGYMSKEAIGGLEGLLAGGYPTHTYALTSSSSEGAFMWQ